MSKIFLSYKHGDNQVFQGLDNKYWAVARDPITGMERSVNEATGRGYANLIEEIIGEEHIYKGESDGFSLAGESDDQIWEYLKPKVHDSTVTVVTITKGMKENFVDEKEQWMPREIQYSLREVDRGGRTSTMNALLGVIIPDRNRSYEYIYEKSDCEHCGHIKMLNKHSNPYLFNILKENIFNHKNKEPENCDGPLCSTLIYDKEDHSYFNLITIDDFLIESKRNAAIDRALNMVEDRNEYDICRSI